MAKDNFDTLGAARSLKTSGIEDEQAEAIVGAIRLAVSDLVTVERFKAGTGGAQDAYGYPSGRAQDAYGYPSGRAQGAYGLPNGGAQGAYEYPGGGVAGGQLARPFGACRRHRRRQRTDADRGRLRAGRGPWRAAAYALIEHAQELLRSVYGYKNFRGRQEEVLAAALAGRDALVLMPTGGGKSLCYQLPAMIRPGVGLVVSPLIALMRDQVSALKQFGVRAEFLNSTLSWPEQCEILDAVSAQALDLLYLAPERLLQEDTLDRLGRVDLAIIAIDEAHCVSQWGHDFRQDYLGLNVLAERFPDVPRMALTATADTLTRREILSRLELNGAEQFVSGFDRPNIRYNRAGEDRRQRPTPGVSAGTSG